MNEKFDFPEDIEERHQFILDSVSCGNYELEWTPIEIKSDQDQIIIFVSKDVMKINGIRINVSARLQQQIADIINVSLPTAKISDIIFDHADIILTPNTMTITSSTDAMIEYSQKIDKQLAEECDKQGIDKFRLAATLGKDWCLDNLADSTHGVNYGWNIKSTSNSWKGIAIYPCCSLMKDPATGSYYKVIQQPSNWHNLDQDDYSQKARYVKNHCILNAKTTTLSNVLTDADLAPMLSYCGVIKNLRQPGV
jgi:hypothetical protein